MSDISCYKSQIFNFYSIDTITELLHNIGVLIKLPTLVFMELTNTFFPKVIYFFEGNCDTGSGVGGIIMGLILYWIIFLIISSEIDSKKS